MRFAAIAAAVLALATAPAPVHAQPITCSSGEWDDFTDCVTAQIATNHDPYHCETWRTVSPSNPRDYQYRALCSGEPPHGLEPVFQAWSCTVDSEPGDEPDWEAFWDCIGFVLHVGDGLTCRVFTVDMGEGVTRARGICRQVR